MFGGLLDRDWGEIHAGGLLVAVPVPDRGGWLVEDGPRWVEARHRVSRSRLLVRTWRASRRARPEDCEQQVRLWRPDLPESSGAQVLEKRQLDAPDGYRTELTVAVEQRDDGELQGFVLAFGAAPGRCLALLFRTVATGRNAERAVGSRLRIIADGSVARLRARQVDDRARGPR